MQCVLLSIHAPESLNDLTQSQSSHLSLCPHSSSRPKAELLLLFHAPAWLPAAGSTPRASRHTYVPGSQSRSFPPLTHPLCSAHYSCQAASRACLGAVIRGNAHRILQFMPRETGALQLRKQALGRGDVVGGGPR